jgi:capsular polysaccharide biosynthesis protein
VRYSVFIVALAIIGAVVAYGVSNLATPKYGARTELQYQLNREQATEFLRTDRGLTTQLLRVKSREVLLPVAEKNKLTYDELAAKVNAALVGESEIIRIQVNDPSKAVAEKLVTEVSDKYMEIVRKTPAAAAATQKYLTDQLAQADAERAALTARQAQLQRANPSNALTPEQLSVQAEIQSLLDQRNSLKAQLDEAKVEGINEAKVSQLAEPFVLDAPVSPKPMKNAVAGGMAGLLLGLVAAMVLVRRRVAVDKRGA